MNVSLTPELEAVIAGKVDSGKYSSASEVVREGLRLLQQRDEMHEAKLNALRTDIQLGIDDLLEGVDQFTFCHIKIYASSGFQYSDKLMEIGMNLV